MNVLIACEESQVVCKAFRARGHRAFSCDIQECSGGHPEWHIQDDVLRHINPSFYSDAYGTYYGVYPFSTCDGQVHIINGKWDLIIAHPPCTYLSSVGASRLFNKDHTIKDEQRERKGWEARAFFMKFWNADCDKVAIENPVPLRHFKLPGYSQIIEPFWFGDPWKKRTCLWLKGLPLLWPSNEVDPKGCWTVQSGGSTCRIRLKGPKGATTAKERSKTFPGIAKAMADQWG